MHKYNTMQRNAKSVVAFVSRKKSSHYSCNEFIKLLKTLNVMFGMLIEANKRIRCRNAVLETCLSFLSRLKIISDNKAVYLFLHNKPVVVTVNATGTLQNVSNGFSLSLYRVCIFFSVSQSFTNPWQSSTQSPNRDNLRADLLSR